jgi:hypothetical protein
MKSLISTNEAYQLASNWLAAISVDVAALEKQNPPSVEQLFLYPDAASIDDPPEKRERVVLLPIFHVKWGDSKRPAIMVSVFGPTKELLGMRQDDDSFSGRPKDLLKDVNTLLRIPDEEFAKYSDAQRRDLIVRFAAVKYDYDVASNAPPVEFFNRAAPTRPVRPAGSSTNSPLPDHIGGSR